jgi:hypothetical protein
MRERVDQVLRLIRKSVGDQSTSLATLDPREAPASQREIQLCDQTEFPSSYEVV